MTTKTITITEDAYEALRGLKDTRESFSETILRVAKKKPLDEFFGVLSKESGAKLERAILELRQKRNLSHRTRMKRIVEAFER